MEKRVLSFCKLGLSMLFGFTILLFWWLAYPHALSYQEQYQLFLWSGDYFCKALSHPGGLADWSGEFVVQFYWVKGLGALLLSILFVMLQRLVSLSMDEGRQWFLLSFIPPVLMLWLMGDESVLLSYMMALVGVVSSELLLKNVPVWADVFLVPLLYWLFGPVAWLYVVLRVVRKGWKALWIVLWLIAFQLVAYHLILTEWPLYSVLTGKVYYRIPLMTPTLMWIIPLSVVVITLLAHLPHSPWMRFVEGFVVVALAFLAIGKGYDEDKYELIRQDYLVRTEQWDEIIHRAEKKQVRTAFSSVCVNLALSQKRQLADRMFDFYQSGRDALFMPMIRDLTSMLPTAEVFWRLGMVNSSQRYMSDTQESILNGKKSGRCTQRIIECLIVNGHYKAAKKQIALLKKSLFYRKWAEEAETYLGKESKINAHPVWGRKRQFRYKDNFLYNYGEMDKMLGQLFVNNPDNKMALDYMLGQMLLNGNVPGFVQYLQWAQRYGGYSSMPLGYQDVMQCVQSNGKMDNSPYLRYFNQQKQQGGVQP